MSSNKKEDIKLTVIIPTYKRFWFLKKTLEALVRQKPRPNEVIVVDNASEIKIKQLTLSHRKYLNVIYLTIKKLGPSYARNLGFQKAKGEIVAFLDDDCVPEKDWTFQILKTYKHDYNNPYIFQEEWYHIFPKQNLLTNLFHLRNRIARKQNIRKNCRLGKYTVIDYLNSGNFYGRKAIFSSLSYLFDENLFPYIGEQKDLAFRLQMQGITILFNPFVKVLHHKHDQKSIRKFLKNVFFYGRADGILSNKYPVDKEVRKLFYKEVPNALLQQYNFFRCFTSEFHSAFLGKSKIWKFRAYSIELTRYLFWFLGYFYGVISYYVMKFRRLT